MKTVKPFRLVIFTLFLLLPVLLTHCTYDNELDKYMDSLESCDTSNVTYSSTIQPILENKCYTCHSDANAPVYGNNIVLDYYSAVQQRSQTIVKAVKHAPGVANMPEGMEKLDPCTIAKIETWVNNGALNN